MNPHPVIVRETLDRISGISVVAEPGIEATEAASSSQGPQLRFARYSPSAFQAMPATAFDLRVEATSEYFTSKLQNVTFGSSLYVTRALYKNLAAVATSVTGVSSAAVAFGAAVVPSEPLSYGLFINATDLDAVKPDSATRVFELFSAPSAAQTAPDVTTRVEIQFSWISEIYKFSKLQQLSSALRVMYWGIETLLKARDIASVNRILLGIELSRLSPEVMTALIRVTSRARHTLPAWTLVLTHIVRELKTRNVHNLEQLLVGLPVAELLAEHP